MSQIPRIDYLRELGETPEVARDGRDMGEYSDFLRAFVFDLFRMFEHGSKSLNIFFEALLMVLLTEFL